MIFSVIHRYVLRPKKISQTAKTYNIFLYHTGTLERVWKKESSPRPVRILPLLRKITRRSESIPSRVRVRKARRNTKFPPKLTLIPMFSTRWLCLMAGNHIPTRWHCQMAGNHIPTRWHCQMAGNQIPTRWHCQMAGNQIPTRWHCQMAGNRLKHSEHQATISQAA